MHTQQVSCQPSDHVAPSPCLMAHACNKQPEYPYSQGKVSDCDNITGGREGGREEGHMVSWYVHCCTLLPPVIIARIDLMQSLLFTKALQLRSCSSLFEVKCCRTTGVVHHPCAFDLLLFDVVSAHVGTSATPTHLQPCRPTASNKKSWQACLARQVCNSFRW